ncbi:MAG: hypothetical protein QGG40_14185, partial [Myxococcota bacterium]|nr:hypothetical protein [Myxococcota bacterium]
MFQSILSDLLSRHDIPPALLADFDTALRQVAAGRASEATTEVVSPPAVALSGLDETRSEVLSDTDPTVLTGPGLASSAAVVDPFEVPARRFEVLGRLGRGGMGEVLRVRELQLNRPVAMKVIRGETDHGDEREFC